MERIELVRPDPFVPNFEAIRNHFLGPIVPSPAPVLSAPSLSVPPDNRWKAINEFIWGPSPSRFESEPQAPELPEEN